MKETVLKIVDSSIKDNSYPKAIDCINALRRGCILEEESNQFNDFMHMIKNKFEKNDTRKDFWIAVKNENISLITTEDSEDSELTPEEAEKVHQNLHTNKLVLLHASTNPNG